jgi:hypothetical protein
LSSKKLEMTLTAALAKDWLEYGQYLSNPQCNRTWGRALLNDQTGLDGYTFLSRLRRTDIIQYRARRLVGHANATINSEIHHLRRVMKCASEEWNVATPKINWKGISPESA